MRADVRARQPRRDAPRAGSSLLHLSDLHFGAESPTVAAALLGLCHRLAPDVAVVTGDVTQRASSRQFAAARAFVQRLGVAQCMVLPGNHDIPLFALWERWWRPFARHARAFGPVLEPEIDLPALLLLGVNSVRPSRHKRGALTRVQIERVSQRLAEASPLQLRVVALHHPLAVLHTADDAEVVAAASDAAHAWAAAGADLVLAGHVHRAFVLPLHRRWPGLARPAWAVHSGTATSLRLRHDDTQSAHHIRHDPGRGLCIVQRWEFRDAPARFVLAEQQQFALHRRLFAGGSGAAGLSDGSDTTTGPQPIGASGRAAYR